MFITKRFLIVSLLLPLIFSTGTASAVGTNIPRNESSQEIILEKKELDKRAQILRAYLSRYNSPLEDRAQDFIDAADTYGVDWKLVPAITGVESTFGKHIPGGHQPEYTSYNGWGWGVYGNQVKKFSSWREGIFTVTGGLKKNYIDKGLTDPYAMNKIYASSQTWGAKVDRFMKDIYVFSLFYEQNQKDQTQVTTSTANINEKEPKNSFWKSLPFVKLIFKEKSDEKALTELPVYNYLKGQEVLVLEPKPKDITEIDEKKHILVVNYTNIENKTVAASAKLASK